MEIVERRKIEAEENEKEGEKEKKETVKHPLPACHHKATICHPVQDLHKALGVDLLKGPRRRRIIVTEGPLKNMSQVGTCKTVRPELSDTSP